MPLERDALIFKALCALSEYADASEAAPIAPTSAMRLALAVLFASSNRLRWPYDSYLAAVQTDDYFRPNGSSAATSRKFDAHRGIRAITHTLRWDRPCHLDELIRAVLEGGDANKLLREAPRLGRDWNVFPTDEVRQAGKAAPTPPRKDCGWL